MTDNLMSNEDAIAASVSGAQATEPSADAVIAADKIGSLDVFTSDRWTERRELTSHARSVIALALDAFAAQAGAAADYYESHEALTDGNYQVDVASLSMYAESA